MRQDYVLTTKLPSFPVSIVKSSSGIYSKKFHSTVFTLYASSESAIHTYAALHSPHFEYGFCLMKQDEGEWHGSDNIEEVRDWVLIHKKETLQLYHQWKKYWAAFETLCVQLDKIKLASLSAANLRKWLTHFHQAYVLAGSIAYITDSFMSVGEKDWLEELLEQEIKLGSAEEKKKAIQLLTTFPELSYAAKFEQEMYAIALMVRKAGILDYAALSAKIKARLRRVEQAYFWINNNYFHVEYVNAEMLYTNVVKVVQEAKQKKLDLYAFCKEREVQRKKIEQQRKKMLRELKLGVSARDVLFLAELFAQWKDIRKSGVCIGMHYYDKFLREMARRTGHTVQELSYLVFPEAIEVLEGKKMKRQIQDRKEQCFFAVTPQGYFIASGKEAQPYFNARVHTQEEVTELRGVAASPGRAIGIVRVILKTLQMKEFKQGEVLVTNQTTPEFVPIMKKAAAIITEQGGITSHAAIISRELKIPCVIGTKIATKVLKTGEKVEVDAMKGVVKKVEPK